MKLLSFKCKTKNALARLSTIHSSRKLNQNNITIGKGWKFNTCNKRGVDSTKEAIKEMHVAMLVSTSVTYDVWKPLHNNP